MCCKIVPLFKKKKKKPRNAPLPGHPVTKGGVLNHTCMLVFIRSTAVAAAAAARPLSVIIIFFAMGKTKPFEEVAKEVHVKETTVKVLLDADVDSVTVLATVEKDDLETFSLTLGQTSSLVPGLRNFGIRQRKDRPTIPQSRRRVLDR